MKYIIANPTNEVRLNETLDFGNFYLEKGTIVKLTKKGGYYIVKAPTGETKKLKKLNYKKL